MTFQDLNSIPGLQFMPIAKNKVPIHKNWESVVTKYDFTNAQACGLVCGSISGNVEVIDFDLKYDLTGTLMREFFDAVNSVNPDLIPKIVVQRTMSGGYHMIYKCEQIEGNQKLANRDTTIEERQSTYNRTFAAAVQKYGATNNINDPNFQKASTEAKKAMDGDKNRVLIETRGEKGQIACYPTPGYTMVQGSWNNIPTISIQEREILFNIAFSFNTYLPVKQDRPAFVQQRKDQKGLSPSDDYNERGDVVGLLLSHGWTYVTKKGDKVILRRPGDTSAKSSGNYDEEKRWFSVFSTSTEFESQKPYKPYAVFAMLECGGDYSQVTKKLAEKGYGDPLERSNQQVMETPSIINMLDEEDFSFLATDEDTDVYIKQWMEGTFVKGLSTGIPALDEYFLFKKGNLVMGNGIDNVGKSTILWYLDFLASFLHGWKHLIFSSENKAGAIKKKIMEFYWCKQIHNFTPEEYKEADDFFKEHFKIIKNGKKLFNYKDILNMATKVKNIFNFDTLLIDPYNSLKLESRNAYEFHYEVASILKLFAEEHTISIYVNAHVGTAGAKKKDDKGYTLAPDKEDTEMGVMFANKADDFLTFHRLTNHETDFLFTELHVRKIKEMETGGKPTPKFKPIIFKSIIGLVGFEQVHEKSHSAAGFNPVLAHRRNKENLANHNIFTQFATAPDLPPVIMQGGEEADFG